MSFCSEPMAPQELLAMGEKVPERRPLRRPMWLSGSSPQYLAAIVVNLLGFSFGTCMGWSSVALPSLKDAGYSDEALSWATGLIFVGAILGAWIFGVITERRGRRQAALFTGVPLLLGWLGLIGDWGIVKLISARILLGVGCGGVMVVCPMYVGEVVEDNLRGMLGSFFPLFLNAGTLFTYAVGAEVPLTALSVVCAVFPLAFLLLFVWFPETPIYLLEHSDEVAAMDSLSWLRDPQRADITAEFSLLKATRKSGEAEAAAGLRDLLASRGSRHATAVVLGLLMLQQLCGITAIISYAASIFESAGSTLHPNSAACVVGAVMLVGSVVATSLMDRVGRVPLLYTSYGCTSCTLAMLGAYFYWPSALPGWLPVLCLSVFTFTYTLGAGPMPFLLIMEVLPPRLRAVASQLGLIALFVLCFLVSTFFGQISEMLQPYGCFWMFSGFCAFAVLFTRVVIPETKGKTVDRIISELEGVSLREDHGMQSPV